MNGHTFRLRLQENELSSHSSVITQTVPLECTHQELPFEWLHHKVSSTVKFAGLGLGLAQ